MYDAILSSEDPRFYQHGGVDLIGTSRACCRTCRAAARPRVAPRSASSTSRTSSSSDASATPTTERRAAQLLDRRDDRSRHRGHPAQAPGDALRHRAGAEVFQERHPSRLPQHRQLRRSDLRHRRGGASTTSASPRRTSRSPRPRHSPASCRTRTPTASTSRAARSSTRWHRLQQGAGRPDRRRRRGSARRARHSARRRNDHAGAVPRAADGYSATKGRQLYVLSRMLEDGKITQEQYDAAAIEPITP